MGPRIHPFWESTFVSQLQQQQLQVFTNSPYLQRLISIHYLLLLPSGPPITSTLLCIPTTTRTTVTHKKPSLLLLLRVPRRTATTMVCKPCSSSEDRIQQAFPHCFRDIKILTKQKLRNKNIYSQLTNFSWSFHSTRTP